MTIVSKKNYMANEKTEQAGEVDLHARMAETAVQ
jgi:hypothetical protein